MSKHTISEAARLVGKHRSTIQKHIKEGKLAKIVDDEGNPYIETSELLRVYQDIRAVDIDSNSDTSTNLQAATPSSTAKIEELETQLELERVKREHIEALLRKTEKSESEWKNLADRLSLLLTDQRQSTTDKHVSERYQRFIRKLQK